MIGDALLDKKSYDCTMETMVMSVPCRCNQDDDKNARPPGRANKFGTTIEIADGIKDVDEFFKDECDCFIKGYKQALINMREDESAMLFVTPTGGRNYSGRDEQISVGVQASAEGVHICRDLKEMLVDDGCGNDESWELEDRLIVLREACAELERKLADRA